jgi:uncharacterized protein (TIGR03435 family)
MSVSRLPNLKWFSSLLLMAATAPPMSAQPSLPAFEVVSVRTIQQDTRTWALRQVNPARYRSLSNVNQLITWAWSLKNYQVLGAPGWIFEDRFEIQATTGHPASPDEERFMVQRLLAERFGMKVHRESREIPVYVLVVGRNGPKLETAETPAEPGHRGININAGVMTAREGTMAEFADVLTTNLDRPVLDRTNLEGHYNFTLTGDPPPPSANGPSWSPIGPSLFMAIRELGLRLDPQKAPVEMLVIDSIKHPTDN